MTQVQYDTHPRHLRIEDVWVSDRHYGCMDKGIGTVTELGLDKKEYNLIKQF